MLKTPIQKAGVPVLLHLDHGQDPEMIADCLRQGYSSVMFDGADLGLEKNISQTRDLARTAHDVSSSLEGELGLFGGDTAPSALPTPTRRSAALRSPAPIPLPSPWAPSTTSRAAST